VNYLPEVVKAKYVKAFVIETYFDDGTSKFLDIAQWFRGPVFRSLKNPRFFQKFFIDSGTLAWPNGVDIAPEALYRAADLRILEK
jgi:hypothetical protein